MSEHLFDLLCVYGYAQVGIGLGVAAHRTLLREVLGDEWGPAVVVGLLWPVALFGAVVVAPWVLVIRAADRRALKRKEEARALAAVDEALREPPS
jgi:hypothetical protein